MIKMIDDYYYIYTTRQGFKFIKLVHNKNLKMPLVEPLFQARTMDHVPVPRLPRLLEG